MRQASLQFYFFRGSHRRERTIGDVRWKGPLEPKRVSEKTGDSYLGAYP